MALLSMEAVRDGVRTDPSLHFHNLDFAREAILVLKLDRAAFRAASFLDDRILTPQSLGRWVKLADLENLLIGPTPALAPHFLFHSGHVGSTLVSRLLDDIPGVLGLREPLPLRVLSSAAADLDAPFALVGPEQWRTLLHMALFGWSRGFADTKAVIVKATSSAAVCCTPLLEASPRSKAVMLNLRAEPYIATLLAGENSYLDLRGHAQDRMRRLLRLAPAIPRRLGDMSLGEIAAMTWTVETLTHLQAQRQFGARVLSVDFDAFLAAPRETMGAICSHFRLDAPADYLDGVGRSPVLTRYSKAPEHAYSPELRAQILAESRRRNASEIRRGLAFIDALAGLSADVAAIRSA